MGQQQLLLLVLGVLLVAFAVVAGMYAFGEKHRQSTVDNLTNRTLAVASESIFWKSKRDPWAGGNASYTNLSFDQMGVQNETPTGIFKITRADGDDLEITGVSKKYQEIGIRVFIHGYSVDSTQIAHDGTITID